jgi:o-succinylbenzoate---CoA ligase
VTAGDRVAIVLPPGLEFARTFHACLLLGAVAVPVDVRLSEGERAVQCDGAALVVSEPPAPDPASDPASDPVGPEVHHLDSVAAIIHTSGTSGSPRPVELTYGNFLWSALGSAVALDRNPGDRWLCTLPVSHVGGLSILVRSVIYGTTAVVQPRFETDRVLKALTEEDITVVSLVATTLTRLLDGGLDHPPALRCALTGGGPVADALIARARAMGVPVSLTYGLTEACSQVTTGPPNTTTPPYVTAPLNATAPPNGPMGDTPNHGGPPLFCTRVRIAPDGEILVAGPTVAPGAVSSDGWLHTGDLGELDSNGCLRVSGRKADTIVTGGENVAPAEVEGVLEAHPDVLEAAVIGRPDPRWGEAVTAIVLPREGVGVRIETLAETLRVHCVERLAPYKVPKQFDLVDEPLPRTRSGKLLRRELT